MGALQMGEMTWREIRAEQERGRGTVVPAFGATERRGPRMPLATDALAGEHLAPAVRFGFGRSERHLEKVAS